MTGECYGLMCPQCLCADFRVRSDDIDADGGFIGDPEVKCMRCDAVLRMSELIPIESTSGHTIHMMREGGDSE